MLSQETSLNSSPIKLKLHTMRQNLKEYYQQLFGDFRNTSVAEIEKSKENDIVFQSLDGVLFLSNGWKVVRKSELVPEQLVRTRLYEYLSRVVN